MGAILQLRGISKNFGWLRALNDVDLEIQEGEILGIIGPNGSGKTTLLNVITGFLKPTGGQIEYMGEAITGLSPYQTAYKGILKTFQLSSVFPNLTVLDNLITASHLKAKTSIWGSLFNGKGYRDEQTKLRERAREILALTGMLERQFILAKNLSLGDQRKLETAIALAAGPKLLLMDEPVTGMTPEEARGMAGLVRTIQGMGITIGIVDHNMKVIMQLCNRIVVLNYGVKIAVGTPQEVAANEAVISAYLGKEEHA